MASAMFVLTTSLSLVSASLSRENELLTVPLPPAQGSEGGWVA